MPILQSRTLTTGQTTVSRKCRPQPPDLPLSGPGALSAWARWLGCPSATPLEGPALPLLSPPPVHFPSLAHALV